MIDQIRLKNCQSWKDITITLSQDTVNVLVAQNDTGKSVLFKILKLAGCPNYYSEKDRVDLIRRGCSFAQAVFKFTDGSFAIMRIERTGTLYFFLEDSKAPLIPYLEPPSEMVNHLGLLVSGEERFIANIIDTDQGLLLVDPKLKSNYELVRMIATCEELDTVRDNVEALIKEFRSYNLRVHDKSNLLERQLTQLKFTDVAAMQEKYERCNLAFDTLYSLCDVLDSAAVVASYCTVATDFDELLNVASILEELESVCRLVKGVVVQPFVSSLVPLADALIDLESIGEWVERVSPLSDVSGCEQCVGLLEVVDSLFSLCSSLEVSLYQAVVCNQEVENLNRAFRESGRVVDCPIYGEVVFDGEKCVVCS